MSLTSLRKAKTHTHIEATGITSSRTESNNLLRKNGTNEWSIYLRKKDRLLNNPSKKSNRLSAQLNQCKIAQFLY